MTTTATPAPAAVGLRLAAALFLLGPALVHVAVVPQHLATYLPYGLFLLAVGLAQAGLATGVILRPSPPLLIGAALGMLAVIAIWILSRTVGMPVGPTPWYREPIGLPDLLTCQMELVAAVLLLVADARLEAARPFRAARALPGLAIALAASGGLTLAALAGVTGAGH